MTTELQHAMAKYEEARAEYRKAVLASLNGEGNGDGIRQAIRGFQAARAELARLGGVAALPRTREPAAVREESVADSVAEVADVAVTFFRRLLSVG